MSDIIQFANQSMLPTDTPALPEPRSEHPVHIRPAVLSDYDFIDALQKANSKAVGFMWEKAIKGHIEKGNVLVAEAAGRHEARGVSDADSLETQPLNPQASSLKPSPVGYVIGVDRYLKRDELGIIYQMNVVPELRRSLVAANLLKAKFEASAYGCRLYCCWCAQDLEANRFWEAMGFVPLAFRTGGGRNKKSGPRMHIFWQKRIRPRRLDPTTGQWVEDDFPYWFPSQTGSGAIGEDRLVLPIPPGTHWSDAKPVVLPQGPAPGSQGSGADEVKLLENEVQRLERERKAKVKQKQAEAKQRMAKRDAKQRTVKRGGLHFGPVSATASSVTAEAEQQAQAAVDAEIKAARKAVRKAKKKFDPAQEAFARELKDRWLERVATDPSMFLPRPKYDVVRRIERSLPGTSHQAQGYASHRIVLDTAASAAAEGEAVKRLEVKRRDAA